MSEVVALLSGLASAMGLRAHLLAALVFVPLERAFPVRGGQPVLREGIGLDLVYLLVNRLLVQGGSALLYAAVVALATTAVPGGLRAAVGGAPLLLVQLPAAILLADLGFWATHRAFHAVPFLWRFHAVHHSIRSMDWIAAARVHPVDQVLTRGLSLAPLHLLGFSDATLTLFALQYFWHAHLLHANVRFSFGPLGAVVASPRWHHWHHADDPAAWNRNFAGQLSLLDRLFGTCHHPDRAPPRLGGGEPLPAGYLGQLRAPFTGGREARAEGTPSVERRG